MKNKFLSLLHNIKEKGNTRTFIVEIATEQPTFNAWIKEHDSKIVALTEMETFKESIRILKGIDNQVAYLFQDLVMPNTETN